MVADKKKIQMHRENHVIHMILPMGPFLLFVCHHIMQFETIKPNNIVSFFQFVMKFKGW